MAPKNSLKECSLFPDSSKPHRKMKNKKTKGSPSVARTIVSCFPSASTTSDSADLSPSCEPIRVPRNPLVRSNLRPRTPCTRDITPKKKRVTFCLPSELPAQRVFVSSCPPSLSENIPVQTTSPSTPSSSSVQCSSSSSLPFGQSLSFSTLQSPVTPSTSAVQSFDSVPHTGRFFPFALCTSS